MLDLIRQTFHRLITSLSFTRHRYLYAQFNLEDRLTGLIGPRGVGKTTLMLQYIKEHLYADQKTLYFSADNIYFSSHSLIEFVNQCYLMDGIRIFFMDEIHQYSNWSQELKNIYDAFPDIKIIFSGSSSIDLVKGGGDLSRRATLFYLHGLSFREYLNFKTNSDFSAVDWNTLLGKHHISVSPEDAGFASSTKTEILKGERCIWAQQFAGFPKLLGHFNDYLQAGYYPFVFENLGSYHEKIARVIEKTIFEDIANYYSLKTNNLHHFKKILNYLATIPPGSISTHSIAKQLGIDDKTTFQYLSILKETGLVRFVPPYGKGKQLLSKPDKIFLNNTTLQYTLHQYLGTQQSDEKGARRELFFAQSVMNAGLQLFTNTYVDFQVAGCLFEIGGKNKDTTQLNKTKLPAFLVKDDVLFGGQHSIPLFYFGFLY
jgi:predicted AAA+ superfamily ATPase